MERAKILNQIISQVKEMREEGAKLFSQEYIVPNAEYMIEENFEAKLIPYFDKITKQIRSLPADEYIIVTLDTWIKDLQDQLKKIEDTIIIEEYAEVLYIRQHFLPAFIDKLQDIKLEMLEREFNVHSQQSEEKHQVGLTDVVALKPEGIAEIITLLYNQGIIKSTISIDDICQNFSALTGYNVNELRSFIHIVESGARIKAETCVEEKERVVRLIKAMGVRAETSIVESQRR